MSVTRALLAIASVALLACNGTPAATDAGHDAFTPPPGDDGGADAFVATDAGGDCHDDYAGCTTFEDHTGVATFTIAATAAFAYDHKCVRVSAGTVVTITNSTTHPLTAATCSTAGGPIPATATPEPGTDPAASTAYTFSTAGHYGYFCANHGADDGAPPAMAGLIVVE